MTPAGIEPAPFQFVATAVPLRRSSMYLFTQSSKARFLKVCYEYRTRYTIIDRKEKLFPAHVINAYSGIRGKVLLIPRLGTAWRWVVSFTPRPLRPRERTTVHTEKRAGWAPETVWTFGRREKVLAPTGTRNPDPPVPNIVTIQATLLRLHCLLVHGLNVLRYKPEVRWFKSRSSHWNFSLT